MNNNDNNIISVNCIDCNIEIKKNKFLAAKKHWSGRCKKCADKRLIIPYIQGQMIGECIFVKEVDAVGNHRRGEFICSCGNHFECKISHVKFKNKISCNLCGYKRTSQSNRKHGLDGVPMYHVWINIKGRCYNEKHTDYLRYGNRGIKMSDEWLNSVETFISDMGERPSKLHSVERRDNNKGYSKENCYWGTKKEQANNRSNGVYLEYNGERLTLAQWCDKLNLPYKPIWKRYNRNQPLSEVFSSYPKKHHFKKQTV